MTQPRPEGDRTPAKEPRFPGLARWLVFGAVVLAYGLTFPWLFPATGGGSIALSLSYLCLAAWFWGLRGGLAAALFDLLFHALLLKLIGASVGEIMFTPTAAISAGVSVGLCALIGRMSDLRRRLKVQMAQRERTEEALRESEETFKVLFEFAPDGYYLSDSRGNFIDGNRAAEEIVGYERNELGAVSKNSLEPSHA